MCSSNDEGRFRYREPFTIYPRKLKSGKVVFYYQFRRADGTRSAARSLGTSSKAEAMRRARRLWREGYFEREGRQKPKAPLFKEFAEALLEPGSEFLLWKEATGRKPAPSTLASYRQLLSTHLVPRFGGMRLPDITPALVKEWVLEKREEVAPKTGNNALSVLNIIMKAAVEKGHIAKSPAEGLGYRKADRKERSLLSVKEIAAIYRASWPSESARRLFLTLAVTGMRAGEAIALSPSDVLPDRLNVSRSYSAKFGMGPTKTRARRVVPIPPSLDLASHCGEKWAFQKPGEDAPVSASSVYKRFRRICASLGIDTKARGITIHSLRNFFISYMRASPKGSEIDLKIKAVVGHAGSTMTDWYTYWKAEDFSEIYALQEELLQKITGK